MEELLMEAMNAVHMATAAIHKASGLLLSIEVEEAKYEAQIKRLEAENAHLRGMLNPTKKEA